MKATPVSPGTVQPQANAPQAPSAAVIADANKPLVTTDARGRQIGYRKPSALDRYRVSKMLGGEIATNQEAAGMAMLAYCCTSIDGEAVPMPNSERAIEALIVRLDNDGINAISMAFAIEYGLAADDEEGKQAVKNS